MALTGLPQLKQDPKNPDQRWLEFTQVYGTGPGANGYPQQYLLTPEQFAQFQNAGLRVQPEFNNPLRYQQGYYQPGTLKKFAKGSEDPNINRIAASVDQMPASGGADLAFDLQARQEILSKAYGGREGLEADPTVQRNLQAAAAQSQKVQAAGFQEPKDLRSNMPIGIQFKPGLNKAQKDSIINLVSNKPESQWNAEDKKNYAYATKLKQGQTGETVWTKQNFPLDQGTNITRVTKDGLDGGQKYMGGSATFNEATGKYEEPRGSQPFRPRGENEDMTSYLQAKNVAVGGVDFGTVGASPVTTNPPNSGVSGGAPQTTGSKYLDDMLAQLQKTLSDILASGKTIPQNIEITPALAQQFLDQAERDMNPYFADQLKSIKSDLTANLSDLQKQYDLQKEDSQAAFRQSLERGREDASNVGTSFSGRQRATEQMQIGSQQRQLDLGALQLGSTIRRTLGNFEQTAGNRELAGLQLPSFSTYKAGPEGQFAQSGTLPSFGGTPNLVGTLENARKKAVDARNASLRQAHLTGRTLDFYPSI